MGAPERPLSGGFEAGSPAPGVELAPVDPSAQSSAARPAPEPGAGCRGRRGAGSLIHSFSADLRCSEERREEGAAANEGPGAIRAPLCSAAGGGKGLREVGSGPLPLRSCVRCAPSLLPAWKWLRLFSGE